MKILSLDVSTKTGFAVIDSETQELLEYGTVLAGHLDEYGEFPRNYSKLASFLATEICNLIDRVKPDVVVVEETNPSGRAGRYSQKCLEFLHCAFLLTIPENYKVVYISTSKWRSALQIKLSKDDRKNNSLVNQAKKAAKISNTSVFAKKAALGVKGKVNWKHLSVRFVNEKYNTSFKMKDNDVADSICLGLAYINGAPHCVGME